MRRGLLPAAALLLCSAAAFSPGWSPKAGASLSLVSHVPSIQLAPLVFVLGF
jgi:hypothetical protein